MPGIAVDGYGLLQPSPAPPNPFNVLPDELISRIFTAGVEFDPLEFPKGGDTLFLSKPFQKSPYPFTTVVQSTCRRFFEICQHRWNAHLHHILVTSSTNTADLGAPDYGVTSHFTQLYHAIKTYSGCDIHASIDLCPTFINSGGATALVIHILRLLLPYRHRLSALEVFTTFRISSEVAAYFLRWFGMAPQAFARLQYASVRIPISFIHADDFGISPADMELYQYDSLLGANHGEFTILHPALVYLFVQGVDDAPKRLQSPFLHTLTIDTAYSECTYDWEVICCIMTEIPTLRRMEMALQNIIHPAVSKEYRKSSPLEQIRFVIDRESMHTILTGISFPLLLRAVFYLPDEFPPDESKRVFTPFTEDVYFPKLKILGFDDNISEPSTFLEHCIAPSLDRLTVTVRDDLQIADVVAQGPLQKLSVLCREPTSSSSLDRFFKFFDDSEIEELLVYNDLPTLQNDVTNIRQSESGETFMVNLPKLRSIDIASVDSLQDTLVWIQARFRLSPPITLTTNDRCRFTLAPSGGTSDGPSSIVVKDIVIPSRPDIGELIPHAERDPLFSSLPGGDFNVIINYSDPYIDILTHEDAFHPAFQYVDSIELRLDPRRSTFHNHIGDLFTTGWLPFIFTYSRDDGQPSAAVPFPHLASFTARCYLVPNPRERRFLVKQLEDFVRVRRNKHPLRSVTLLELVDAEKPDVFSATVIPVDELD